MKIARNPRGGKKARPASRRRLGTAGGQIVAPTMIVLMMLFLFVWLIWDTTVLSHEKIRHQLAMDTAVFASMRKYSDLLNLSALWVNGPNSFHMNFESFWPPNDPATGSSNCVSVPTVPGYSPNPVSNPPDCVNIQGKWKGDKVFRLFYLNGLFPVPTDIFDPNSPDAYAQNQGSLDDGMNGKRIWNFAYYDAGIEAEPGSNPDWNGNDDPKMNDFSTQCQYTDGNGAAKTIPSCLDVWRWQNYAAPPGDPIFRAQHVLKLSPAADRYGSYYLKQERMGFLLGKLYNDFVAKAGGDLTSGGESAFSSGQLSYALGYQCNLEDCSADAKGHLAGGGPLNGDAPPVVAQLQALLGNFTRPDVGFIPHCASAQQFFYADPGGKYGSPSIKPPLGGPPAGGGANDPNYDSGNYLQKHCDLGPAVPGPDWGLFRLVTVGKDTLSNMRYTFSPGASWSQDASQPQDPAYRYQFSQDWNPPTTNHFGVVFRQGCPDACVHAAVALGTKVSADQVNDPQGSLWPNPTPKFQTEVFP